MRSDSHPFPCAPIRARPEILLVLAAAACVAGDEVSVPEISEVVLSVPDPGALVVSDPTASMLAASAATAEEVTFISLRPGTVPGATTASVTVQRTGASAATPMIDGGFDPIAVPAADGDSVEITFSGPGTAPSFSMKVPVDAAPRVVRTRPIRGKRDVVLNEIITVVFSEPIDPTTVTSSSVTLEADGVPVTGELVVSADGLTLELRPSQDLPPNTDHRLTITTAVEDREGDALEAAYSTDFTTGNAVAEGELIFQRGLDVWVMNADGSGQERLFENGFVPRWSPDGLRIALGGGWLINPDGTGRTQLVAGMDAHIPAWSPDGHKIAFYHLLDGANEIYVINTDGTGLTQLTSDDAFPPNTTDWPERGSAFPSYSPDGSRITFERTGAGIWIMNADGSGAVQVTTNHDAEPNWSPDGVRIAFVSARYGDPDLFVMNIDGTGLSQLTFDPAIERTPAWSPDGEWIAFHTEIDGDAEIFLIRPDGTGLTQLTFNEVDDLWPSWRW